MAWDDVAQNQSGVISRRQLRSHGVDDPAVDRMIAARELWAPARGVLMVRGAPVTYDAQTWIAVIAADGVLGFGTAAHRWGFIDDPPADIDVVVGWERRVGKRQGVRHHRVFVPSSAVTTFDGLPITSRVWSLLDHLGRLRLSPAVTLADRALQQGWMTRKNIEDRLEEYPGRQGNGLLRKLLKITADGAAAPSERILHQLLDDAGVTGWAANYAVRVRGRIVARIDVALPEVRLAIEVDGLAFHTDTKRFQKDRTRQNMLQQLGWTVVRFTWSDLTERPDYVLGTVRHYL